jgi:hypothetical protein
MRVLKKCVLSQVTLEFLDAINVLTLFQHNLELILITFIMVVVMLYLPVPNVYPIETAGIYDASTVLLLYVSCTIYIHLLFLMSILSKLKGSFSSP